MCIHVCHVLLGTGPPRPLGFPAPAEALQSLRGGLAEGAPEPQPGPVLRASRTTLLERIPKTIEFRGISGSPSNRLRGKAFYIRSPMERGHTHTKAQRHKGTHTHTHTRARATTEAYYWDTPATQRSASANRRTFVKMN